MDNEFCKNCKYIYKRIINNSLAYFCKRYPPNKFAYGEVIHQRVLDTTVACGEWKIK